MHEIKNVNKSTLQKQKQKQKQEQIDKEIFEEIHSKIYGFLPQPDKYQYAWIMFQAGMGHARKTLK